MKNFLPYLLFGAGAGFLGVGVYQTDFTSKRDAKSEAAGSEEFQSLSEGRVGGEEIFRRADPRFEVSLVDAQLEKMISGIDRFLKTYASADFDSFAQWHRNDLEFASQAKVKDAQQLRARMSGIMGIPGSLIPLEWIPVTKLYWEKLYAAGAPLKGIDPASASIFAGEFRGTELPDLEAAYEDAKVSHSLHTLAVPHRRSLQELQASGAPLIWFTFRAKYQFRDGGAGRDVILRFVWDAQDQDWFLEGAASTFNGNKESPYLLL